MLVPDPGPILRSIPDHFHLGSDPNKNPKFVHVLTELVQNDFDFLSRKSEKLVRVRGMKDPHEHVRAVEEIHNSRRRPQ